MNDTEGEGAVSRETAHCIFLAWRQRGFLPSVPKGDQSREDGPGGPTEWSSMPGPNSAGKMNAHDLLLLPLMGRWREERERKREREIERKREREREKGKEGDGEGEKEGRRKEGSIIEDLVINSLPTN